MKKWIVISLLILFITGVTIIFYTVIKVGKVIDGLKSVEKEPVYTTQKIGTVNLYKVIENSNEYKEAVEKFKKEAGVRGQHFYQFVMPRT